MKHPVNMDTMEKVARWLVSKYNEKQCLGTRLLLGEEKVNNNDGKSATKLIQGEYVWITYSDLERLSRSFARGLVERGVKPRDKVRIVEAELILACKVYLANTGMEGCHSSGQTQTLALAADGPPCTYLNFKFMYVCM